MKVEKAIVLVYLVLGLIVGVISNYLSLLLAVAVAFAIYFVSVIPLKKLVKQKKFSWLISNSFVTFLLVWLVVWILLFNLR